MFQKIDGQLYSKKRLTTLDRVGIVAGVTVCIIAAAVLAFIWAHPVG